MKQKPKLKSRRPTTRGILAQMTAYTMTAFFLLFAIPWILAKQWAQVLCRRLLPKSEIPKATIADESTVPRVVFEQCSADKSGWMVLCLSLMEHEILRNASAGERANDSPETRRNIKDIENLMRHLDPKINQGDHMQIWERSKALYI